MLLLMWEFFCGFSFQVLHSCISANNYWEVVWCRHALCLRASFFFFYLITVIVFQANILKSCLWNGYILLNYKFVKFLFRCDKIICGKVSHIKYWVKDCLRTIYTCKIVLKCFDLQLILQNILLKYFEMCFVYNCSK